MLDAPSTSYDMEILEAAIAGVHEVRVNHGILATLATRTDSVLLARAALDAIHVAGFIITKAAAIRP